MGLIDIISKKIKSAIGWEARLNLQIEGNGIIEYLLNIEVADQNFLAEKIYIKLENIEYVEVEFSISPDTLDIVDVSETMEKKVIKKKNVLCSKEIILAENIILEKGQDYNYNDSLSLSELGVSSFKGKYSEVNWEFQAFIESSGINPSSRLITI